MRYIWTIELPVKLTDIDRDLIEPGDTWRTLAERDMDTTEAVCEYGDVITVSEVIFEQGDPEEGDEP